jgi:hypothetical protein
MHPRHEKQTKNVRQDRFPKKPNSFDHFHPKNSAAPKTRPLSAIAQPQLKTDHGKKPCGQPKHPNTSLAPSPPAPVPHPWQKILPDLRPSAQSAANSLRLLASAFSAVGQKKRSLATYSKNAG